MWRKVPEAGDLLQSLLLILPGMCYFDNSGIGVDAGLKLWFCIGPDVIHFHTAFGKHFLVEA